MAITVDELLTTTVQMSGSDLHIKADSPPLVRVYGDLFPLDYPAFTMEQAKELSYSILSPEQIAHFEEDLELDLAYEIPGLARFRGNLMQQRGNVGSVFRVIPLKIQTMEELNLPMSALGKASMSPPEAVAQKERTSAMEKAGTVRDDFPTDNERWCFMCFARHYCQH